MLQVWLAGYPAILSCLTNCLNYLDKKSGGNQDLLYTPIFFVLDFSMKKKSEIMNTEGSFHRRNT